MVTKRDGGIIGFSMVGSASGSDGEHGVESVCSLELFTLYLRAEYHGSGAGQSLFDAALGDQPAQLWVARENHRAGAFYARNGFEPDGAEFVDPAHPDLVEVRLVQ